MTARGALLVVTLAAAACSVGEAFMTPNAVAVQRSAFLPRTARSTRDRQVAQASIDRQGRVFSQMSTSVDIKELGLTPELERLTKVFKSCPTDKMRQMQLLHLAQMGEGIDPALMTEENKVLGCLSTVYVAAEVKEGLIYYKTDSDAMITKGLAGLLSMGLSGNTAGSIQAVKPDFIKVAGLQASLTAGRNNGFINMLRTMKSKALALGGEPALRAAVEQMAPAEVQEEVKEGGTMAARISEKLQKLEPLELAIIDESGGEESKFVIKVVSKAFEGLPLLKRHRTVYGAIADEMKIIHAASLVTNTPEEVGM